MAFELIRLGVQVWLDEERLGAGVHVFDDISAGIDASQAVLFMVSQESMASRYVQHEIDIAADRGKETVTVLLPGMTDDLVPEPLRRFKMFKASRPADFMRIAHEVRNSYTSDSHSRMRSHLWIRDPAVDLSGTPPIEYGFSPGTLEKADDISVRFLDGDFGDLRERAFIATGIDISRLAGTPSHDTESRRLSDLPRIVSSAAAYVANMALFFDRPRSDFGDAYLASLLLVLIRSLRSELDLAEHNSNLSHENASRVSTRRGEWTSAQPFKGQQRIDISVSGFHLGATTAPEYVEHIDLPPGLVAGRQVLLPTDLGTAAGWVTGWRTWNSIKGRRMPEACWPTIDDVRVGPA
jgi:hypothetical protein